MPFEIFAKNGAPILYFGLELQKHVSWRKEKITPMFFK